MEDEKKKALLQDRSLMPTAPIDTGEGDVVTAPVVRDNPFMPTAPIDTGEPDVPLVSQARKPLPSDGLMKGLFDDSYLMSPEEEQRRMNRMRTASAIGNLGNVMSAFANLYYTGKGAPSQKVPDPVIPPYMQFVDRVNQARKNAEAQKIAKEKYDLDYALKERQQTRMEEDMRLKYRKQDWLEKYQAGLLDLKEEQNRINEEYKKGQISIQEQRAASDELRALAASLNAKTNASKAAYSQLPETTEKTNAEGETVSVTKYRGNKGGGGSGGQGGKAQNNQQQTGTLLPRKK